MTTRLPVVLESIRIATPCQADWDEMAGSDRVRFCGRCEKNVYNLSAMSRDEAESMVRDKEGRMCVRLYQRSDGTVLTSDCPVGVRRARLRHRVWASISGVAASAALLLGLAGGRARADLTVGDGKKPASHPTAPLMGTAMPATPPPHVMGKMAPVDPKTTKTTKTPAAPTAPTVKMGEPAPIMGDIAVTDDKK